MENMERAENLDYLWEDRDKAKKARSPYILTPENSDIGKIDPLELFPDGFKDDLLGDFETEKRKNPESKKARLMYENGEIEVEQDGAGNIECIMSYMDESPVARWKIWNEQSQNNKNLLGIDIETSIDFEEIKLYEEIDEDDAREKFNENPYKYLAEGDEKRFIQFWKERFAKCRNDIPHLNFYPGQAAEANSFGITILENATLAAKEHNYDGVVNTPAYIHTAENLERQGFEFEKPEDRMRMDMLKIALRAIDKKRFGEAYEKAVAELLPENEARKKASESRLTPQERSWIVLLNSIKNQNFIPEEFNLGIISSRVLDGELKKTKAYLNEIDHGSGDSIEFDKALGRFLYPRRKLLEREKGETLNEIRARLAFDKDGYPVGNREDIEAYNKLYPIAFDVFPDFEKYLKKQEISLGTKLKVLAKNKNQLGFLPNKMILDFEIGKKTPEYAQAEMDKLIENEIVTGATINPPESYVERVVENKMELPYTVVYHMYDKKGEVKQPDGSMVERKNIEHFEEVQKEIESMGLNAHAEKAYGNVRNPGPNTPLGWKSEEPSVWTDELKGIERSSQNVLVVECGDIQEVEKVSKYLNQIGRKDKENETHTDPAWYVPDIRIFGLKKEDKVKNFAPALLHIKKGQKDGYASTLTHETHRMVAGFKHVPVFIHEKMDKFIKNAEEERGEYEFVSS